jgi:hypothetical protein
MAKEVVSRVFGGLALPWTTADVAAYPLPALFPWLLLIFLGMVAVVRSGLVPVESLFACIGWIVLSTLPLYGYFYVSPALEGSRYLYLGSAGLGLIIALAGSGLPAGLATAVGTALTGASVLAGVFGVLLHQQAWIAAAERRDDVLNAARVLTDSQCLDVTVTNLPDVRDGAYIFRNGFAEALMQSGVNAPAVIADSACVFEWSGTALVRTR